MVVPHQGRGRPRRLDGETERRMILDSALDVMRRNGYLDATVAEILEDADLSTRSFYRHFESKDALLCALYRRDAERAVQRLERRAAKEATAEGALRAWIEEVISFRFDPRKFERYALIGSSGARRADGFTEVSRDVARLMSGTLRLILERGRADGVFPTTNPTADSLTIRAVVLDVIEYHEETGLSQDQAVEHVLRFCAGALGFRC